MERPIAPQYSHKDQTLETCQPFWSGREEKDAAFSPQDGSCALCVCMLVHTLFFCKGVFIISMEQKYISPGPLAMYVKSPILFWQEAKAAAGEIIE